MIALFGCHSSSSFLVHCFEHEEEDDYEQGRVHSKIRPELRNFSESIRREIVLTHWTGELFSPLPLQGKARPPSAPQ
jgi:hypothetical protein